MTLPAAPFSTTTAGPGEPEGPAGPVPRFPAISLTVLVLAFLGVLTAIGLAISVGVQVSSDNQRAMDEAVRVASHEEAQVRVNGPDDVIHVWVVIPGDAAAWRSDGTLVYPDVRPFVARQDGTRLLPDDELTDTQFGFEASDTLTDGSTLVKIDDIHPLRSGTVDVQTQDLAPGNELRLALEPSRTAVTHRAVAAGITAAVSILVGLAALVTFIVMLVRRQRAKPKRPTRLPPPPGPGSPYPGYQPYQPHPGYQPYQLHPGYPPPPAHPPPSPGPLPDSWSPPSPSAG